MKNRISQVVSTAAVSAVIGTTVFSNLSANAQSTTNASLQVLGGAISIYAGDSFLNNDICSAANITTNTTVEGVACSITENSIALPSIAIKPNRQNPFTTLNDVIVDDLRGVATSLYTVTAEFSDFADGSNSIDLGTNPDNASGIDTGTVTAINIGGTLQTINVSAGGTGYTSSPNVNISGGGGFGATATATVSAGAVTAINITNPGSGYTTTPTITLTGGSGSGAAASAILTSGGSGYTTTPTITLTGGGGTGAAATPTLTSGVITAISITNAGSGYTSPPTVTITGGGGSGASATATIIAQDENLSVGTVNGVNVTAGGSGYSATPTVTISGGAGTGATARATVSGGAISAIIVTNPGSGFTSAPTVTITDATGTGATATTAITAQGAPENNIFITADPSVGTIKALSPASLSASGFNVGPRSLVTSNTTQYTLFTTGSTGHATGRFGIDGTRYGLRVPAYVSAGNYTATIVQTVIVDTPVVLGN